MFCWEKQSNRPSWIETWLVVVAKGNTPSQPVCIVVAVYRRLLPGLIVIEWIELPVVCHGLVGRSRDDGTRTGESKRHWGSERKKKTGRQNVFLLLFSKKNKRADVMWSAWLMSFFFSWEQSVWVGRSRADRKMRIRDRAPISILSFYLFLFLILDVVHILI